MGLSVSIEKKFYDNVNMIASKNPKEQMMLVGGRTVGDSVVIDKNSLKWFSSKDLIAQDDESVSIDEGLLVKSIMDISNRGYDSVFMIHSHPCETDFDDYLYGSLSSQDLRNSKKLYLITQFKNIKYFDGISTGKNIYFWSLDNEFLKPTQVSCYVDGKYMASRVPGTIQELVVVVLKK